MESYRSSGKKEEARKTNWQELYILTRHWISDLEFYIEDLQFLHRLIDRYSLWIQKHQNSVAVGQLLSNLHELSSDGKKIREELQEHQEQLSSLLNGEKGGDPDVYLRDHEVLEDAITRFVKNFRSNRKEVYRIAEEVIDSEDLSEHSSD